MKRDELLTSIKKMVPFDDEEKTIQQLFIKALNEYENIFTRKNPFLHITSSAWIINNEMTKILLAYHNIYQSFSWIGGHNDGESDCAKVVLKEVKEESGLKNPRLLSTAILALDILPVPPHYKNDYYIVDHLHLNVTYLVQADENEKLVVNVKENSEVRWFTFAEYEDYIKEKRMLAIYRKLNTKIKESLWQS